MNGGAHGTDLLAGRVFALLARNWLEESVGIVERRLIFGGIASGFAAGSRERVRIIAINANPVHFASPHHLFFAHYRDVVFRLASDDAGVAAVAAIQVNRHRPFVALVRKFRLAFVERIVY